MCQVILLGFWGGKLTNPQNSWDITPTFFKGQKNSEFKHQKTEDKGGNISFIKEYYNITYGESRHITKVNITGGLTLEKGDIKNGE